MLLKIPAATMLVALVAISPNAYAQDTTEEYRASPFSTAPHANDQFRNCRPMAFNHSRLDARIMCIDQYEQNWELRPDLDRLDLSVVTQMILSAYQNDWRIAVYRSPDVSWRYCDRSENCVIADSITLWTE